MQRRGPSIPIACSLETGDLAARVEWWRAVTAHALASPEVTEAGARVRLPAVLEVEVRRLVEAEARCCAFFEFDIALDGAELVLAIGAPPEARPLVDALLAAASPETA